MHTLSLAVLALAAVSGCIQVNVGPPADETSHDDHQAMDQPTTAPEPEFAVTFSWTPANPSVRDTVVFQATVENRGDRTIDTWYWDWGDGETGNGPRATHKWDTPVLEGYEVTLRVLASDGQHEVSDVVFVTG